MKIVADRNIPFLEGVFEPYAEVVYIDGNQITHNDVVDADALIIRTRTRCNAELLDGTKVKMISTATIGTDHIDLKYCAENGIEVNNAEGCNAGGVMQYVFSALYGVAARKNIKLDGANFGKHATANLDYDAEVIPYDENVGVNIEKLGFSDNKIFFAEIDELCEDEKNIRSYNNGLL